MLHLAARPALLLLALAGLACTPKAPEDTAGDTEATDSTGDATTGDTDTSSSGATDPTTGGEDACTAPDPAARASAWLDLGQWPVSGAPDMGEPQTAKLAADCAVQSVTTEGSETILVLTCTEGQVIDQTVRLGFTAPADFGVDLAGATDVRLDAYWQGDGHHVGSGEWFVVHDAGSGDLLLAGLDHDSATSPSEVLAPLTVDYVDDVCPATCGDCLDQDGTERIALAFTHADGSLALVDQQRGQLEAGGRVYDIILSEAVDNYCLNCWSDYVWLLAGAPQGA